MVSIASSHFISVQCAFCSSLDQIRWKWSSRFSWFLLILIATHCGFFLRFIRVVKNDGIWQPRSAYIYPSAALIWYFEEKHFFTVYCYIKVSLVTTFVISFCQIIGNLKRFVLNWCEICVDIAFIQCILPYFSRDCYKVYIIYRFFIRSIKNW